MRLLLWFLLWPLAWAFATWSVRQIERKRPGW